MITIWLVTLSIDMDWSENASISYLWELSPDDKITWQNLNSNRYYVNITPDQETIDDWVRCKISITMGSGRRLDAQTQDCQLVFYKK